MNVKALMEIIVVILCICGMEVLSNMIKDKNVVIRLIGYIISISVGIFTLVVILYNYFGISLPL